MQDVAQQITDSIISELEKGAVPWVKPWRSLKGTPAAGMPYNPVSRTVYRGANLFWLQMIASNYSMPWFVTYKQAQTLGGNVKKGVKGTPVVYWSIQKKGQIGENGEVAEKSHAFLKCYTVFNVDQCEGLKLPEPPKHPQADFEPDEIAMSLVDRLGLAGGLHHGGDEAFFSPSRDMVMMPPLAAFKSSKDYHATLLHEAIHATGHKSRLNRLTPTAFGSEEYAFEELVAELGAAMLCQYCGIDGDLRHAGYIESWLKALRSDKRFILSAASKAQKAMDWLTQSATTEESEEQPLAA